MAIVSIDVLLFINAWSRNVHMGAVDYVCAVKMRGRENLGTLTGYTGHSGHVEEPSSNRSH
jgi:hypothetical protein